MVVINGNWRLGANSSGLKSDDAGDAGDGEGAGDACVACGVGWAVSGRGSLGSVAWAYACRPPGVCAGARPPVLDGARRRALCPLACLLAFALWPGPDQAQAQTRLQAHGPPKDSPRRKASGFCLARASALLPGPPT